MKTRKEIEDEALKAEQEIEENTGPILIEDGMLGYFSGSSCVSLSLQNDNANYSLPYSYMHGVNYNPTLGIKIYHSGFYAEIYGRNLKQIFNLLNYQQLASVRVAAYEEADDYDVYIEKIAVLTAAEYLEYMRNTDS